MTRNLETRLANLEATLVDKNVPPFYWVTVKNGESQESALQRTLLEDGRATLPRPKRGRVAVIYGTEQDMAVL